MSPTPNAVVIAVLCLTVGVYVALLRGVCVVKKWCEKSTRSRSKRV